jgi:hypothetical protein
MPRRAAYRIFVTQHFREFAAIGTASRKALEKYFNPQNPHKDRVTKYISKVAPLMAFIERCRSASSRDKKFNEFGYFVNHPLRANAVAYAAMKGMKAEEVFDVLRDEYVMRKEVGKKYEVVDQALGPYGFSLKMFFEYLGVGKWEGGCIVCRLVDPKAVLKRIANGVLSTISHDHGDREGLAALEALCPELFTKVALEDAHKKKGIRRCENDKPNDVLLCRCTQALVKFWDMPFDMKFVNLCWLQLFTPHLTQSQVADLVREVGSEGIGVVQLEIELRRYDILHEGVNRLFFEKGGLSSMHHLSTVSAPGSFSLETALDVVNLMRLYPASKLGMEGGARGGAQGGADDVLRVMHTCPITHEVMHHPVVAADGHTYDRAFIRRWMDNELLRPGGNSWRSPMTNKEHLDTTLRPNYALQNYCATYHEEEAAAAAAAASPPPAPPPPPPPAAAPVAAPAAPAAAPAAPPPPAPPPPPPPAAVHQ